MNKKFLILLLVVFLGVSFLIVLRGRVNKRNKAEREISKEQPMYSEYKFEAHNLSFTYPKSLEMLDNQNKVIPLVEFRNGDSIMKVIPDSPDPGLDQLGYGVVKEPLTVNGKQVSINGNNIEKIIITNPDNNMKYYLIQIPYNNGNKNHSVTYDFPTEDNASMKIFDTIVSTFRI